MNDFLFFAERGAVLSYDKVLSQVFLGNDEYERLREFFVSSWNQECDDGGKYRYRVYLAQKCLNLNEMFCQSEIPDKDDDDANGLGRVNSLREQTFISQTALLLKAREYADQYLKCGEFPPTLIIDELAISGHDFGELMYRFADLITAELAQLSDGTAQDLHIAVYNALSKAVRFFVYMRNDSLLLLERPLKKMIVPANRDNDFKIGDLYRFALGVSNVITLSPSAANTSFTPSFLVDRRFYTEQSAGWAKQGWHAEDWTYRGSSVTVWQKSLCDAGNEVHIHAAVFCNYNFVNAKMWLTPYLFWGDVSNESIYRLFAALSDQLSAIVFKPFIDILSYRQSGMLHLQTKFLSTLASYLLFYELIGDSKSVQICDVDKTAQCYGTLKDILPAFGVLGSKNCATLRSALWSKICSSLMESACSLAPTAKDETPEHDRARYILTAEDYFSQLDRFVRKQRWQRHELDVRYAPWSDFDEDDCTLTDYLLSFPQEMISLDRKLGALILLLQQGMVGWSTYANPGSTLTLKVGEATGSIAVMHMYRFFPALVELERICMKNDLSTLSRAELFGSYLDQKYNGGNHQELFRTFVSGIYESGMRLSDWDIDCRMWLDLPDFSKGIRTLQEWTKKPWPEAERTAISAFKIRDEYLLWEAKQQNHYREEVFSFFSKKN